MGKCMCDHVCDSHVGLKERPVNTETWAPTDIQRSIGQKQTRTAAINVNEIHQQQRKPSTTRSARLCTFVVVSMPNLYQACKKNNRISIILQTASSSVEPHTSS
jgi:hypothetical protein